MDFSFAAIYTANITIGVNETAFATRIYNVPDDLDLFSKGSLLLILTNTSLTRKTKVGIAGLTFIFAL